MISNAEPVTLEVYDGLDDLTHAIALLIMDQAGESNGAEIQWWTT